MKAKYLYIYLLGIREELYAAAHAHARIVDAAARVRDSEDNEPGERDDLFEEVDAQDDLRAAIEALLSAHARLSLYLFPNPRAGARGGTRAKELRDRLEVSDDHALRAREPRNTWMHLDESIDARVWEGEAEDLIHEHFGDLDLALLADAERRIVRIIDPAAHQIVLLGQRFDLDEIYRQTMNISPALELAIGEIEAELEREFGDLSHPPESLDDVLDVDF